MTDKPIIKKFKIEGVVNLRIYISHVYEEEFYPGDEVILDELKAEDILEEVFAEKVLQGDIDFYPDVDIEYIQEVADKQE